MSPASRIWALGVVGPDAGEEVGLQLEAHRQLVVSPSLEAPALRIDLAR